MEFRVDLAKKTPRAVLILPGAGANVSGEHEGDIRYDLMAKELRTLGASVIQCSNVFDETLWPPDAEEKNARLALDKAQSIANDHNIQITGLGFSAGARLLAQYAHEYSAVDHISLINPDPGPEPEQVLEGLEQYTGTTNIAIGLKDDKERLKFAEQLCRANSKSGNCVDYIRSADHLFTGQQEKFIELAASAIPAKN